MAEAKKGYVYVLTNESFKDNWVKIGRTERFPDVRSKELYNTSIPLPYEVYATLKTAKYKDAEQHLHATIDHISKLRIASNREFFNITPEIAYELLLSVANMLDDAEVTLYGDTVQIDSLKEKRKVSARFDFFTRGIEKGSKIVFIDEPSFTAIVENGSEVLFEGRLWHLSPLTRELYTRLGKVNASGAYQGPLYFSYNGKKLTDFEVNEPK